MMVHSLIPWTQLTRYGVPDSFTVIRKPLQGMQPGVLLPAGMVLRSRLRQLYEQRRIEPTVAPAGSRQAHTQPQPQQTPRPVAPHPTRPAQPAHAAATGTATVVPVPVILSVAIPLAESESGEQSGEQSASVYLPSRSHSHSRKGAKS